ncbi:M20 family metallopeptidase [Alkaliphilus peptidifermentans]|uniref:Acetylornithine deacetylase n=1 Tax=Alkaliphilus peptidifermentans DSM 18978 TaxID=1120976 RepID=A0A1G5K3N0_9FIRM|nr:M20 family metallopeptidase [Alkaliphilus peptidifermentans]SCY95265.1 acetylornithine deacetylase [Alkaliphilus peptidifermentans DSM 18978]
MHIKDLVSDEEVIEIAKKLISIESHKDVTKQEYNIAQWIQEKMTDEGIQSWTEEVVQDRPNVYAQIDGQDKQLALMFNGHTDTIPGFNMDYKAFEPFIKDNKLHGRGSVDMKGGIAAMLAAMIAVKRSNLKLSKGVIFAGVIDEEQCSKGTESIIKSTNIRPQMAVIGEPTELNVSVVHKGMEWIEVVFKGKSGHGSRPHEGINAIYIAAEFIQLIKNELAPKIEDRLYEKLGSGTINVGIVRGGNDPNIIPDECIVRIDRRYLPNETLEDIHKEIEVIANNAIEVTGGSFELRRMSDATASLGNTPHCIDIEETLVKESLMIVQSITGKNQVPKDFPGWSDAALLSNNLGTHCIVLGPGNINQAHANDEFCSIDEIIMATEIYFNLIKNLCS